MSCRHAEDVCQHCLEKVQKTTEDSPPPRALTAGEKRNRILLDSSLLAAAVAIAYLNGKLFFEIAAMTFDSILDTIATPTE